MIAKVKAQSFRCSFCGKARGEVANIMAGTPQRNPGVPTQMIGKSAFICDECVRHYRQLVTARELSRNSVLNPK
ncbi:MAG: hypothetical protein ABR555_02845 [Pyrinomonadaceae bacterium]